MQRLAADAAARARLEFDRVDRVRPVIDPVMPYHRGGMGTEAVNGPVLAGLFDLAIGTVGWLSRPDTRSATVTLAMTFLRPDARRPSRSRAASSRRHEPDVRGCRRSTDERGEVTARCDGTVAVAHGKFESNDFYAVDARIDRIANGTQGDPA